MENNKSKTTVLREFDNSIEAQYAIDILRQNGVECFLSNELGTQLYPIFSSSISGVRLHIFETDFDKATDLLATFLKEN